MLDHIEVKSMIRQAINLKNRIKNEKEKQIDEGDRNMYCILQNAEKNSLLTINSLQTAEKMIVQEGLIEYPPLEFEVEGKGIRFENPFEKDKK